MGELNAPAPGNRIVSYQSANSNLAKNYPGNRPDVTYYFPASASAPSPQFFQLSGTSMAAPVVSGIVVELLMKTPTLTPDQVKARLMRTAWRGFPSVMSTFDPTTNKTYTAYNDLFTVGAGMVGSRFSRTNMRVVSGSSPGTSLKRSESLMAREA